MRQRFFITMLLPKICFIWDNDLERDADRKLKIQPNSFTDWILKDQGQDRNIITNFQKLTGSKINPVFNIADDNITFTMPESFSSDFSAGSDISSKNIKISKGEESNFIWSIFYTLLDQVITILNVDDLTNRETDKFNQLEYVFIDDPVSSLDENHLIELAVNLAGLIKSSESDLKFIITTHSPLFYNILHNDLNHSKKYRLDKKADGSFQLETQSNDSPFSYHLFLLSELNRAIENDQIKKYHFNFFRNILEKTATFLGYKKWSDLLPETNDGVEDELANRILNLSSHSAHAGEEITDIEERDKEKLREWVAFLIDKHAFKQEKQRDRINSSPLRRRAND